MIQNITAQQVCDRWVNGRLFVRGLTHDRIWIKDRYLMDWLSNDVAKKHADKFALSDLNNVYINITSERTDKSRRTS